MLQGNASRKFLKHADKLEVFLRSHSLEAYILDLSFLRVLRSFNKVVDLCSGIELAGGREEAIGEFSSSYKTLENKNSPHQSPSLLRLLTVLLSYNNDAEYMFKY